MRPSRCVRLPSTVDEPVSSRERSKSVRSRLSPHGPPGHIRSDNGPEFMRRNSPVLMARRVGTTAVVGQCTLKADSLTPIPSGPSGRGECPLYGVLRSRPRTYSPRVFWEGGDVRYLCKADNGNQLCVGSCTSVSI
jgi:hypothetical protein